jgi:hypothetical protein
MARLSVVLNLDSQWYLGWGDEEQGPMQLQTLQALLSSRQSSGGLTDETVWNPTMSEWLPVADVPALREIVLPQSASASAPEPPSPPPKPTGPPPASAPVIPIPVPVPSPARATAPPTPAANDSSTSSTSEPSVHPPDPTIRTPRADVAPSLGSSPTQTQHKEPGMLMLCDSCFFNLSDSVKSIEAVCF